MAISLPPGIRSLTEGMPYQTNSVGLSGSKVLIYPDRVLKIGPCTRETANELVMLRYLEGRLPVARLLAWEEAAGLRYLLTSRVPGVMACDASLMADVPHVARLLAEGLQMLWSIDGSDCPTDMGLDTQLRMAEERVAQGKVSPSWAETGGFDSPEALLCWLQDNRPEETPVFSHGDYCLPNVMVKDGHISGLIDLGQCGMADKWLDITLCFRSLMHNCNGCYGTWPGWTRELLFDALGIAPDWDRIRYHLLLDSLF